MMWRRKSKSSTSAVQIIQLRKNSQNWMIRSSKLPPLRRSAGTTPSIDLHTTHPVTTVASACPRHPGALGCVLETSGIMVHRSDKQAMVSRNSYRQLFGDSTNLLSLEQKALRLQKKLDDPNLQWHAAKH